MRRQEGESIVINVKLIIFSENFAQLLTALLGMLGFVLVEPFGDTLGLSAYQTAMLAIAVSCVVGLNSGLQERIRQTIYRILIVREVIERSVACRKSW